MMRRLSMGRSSKAPVPRASTIPVAPQMSERAFDAGGGGGSINADAEFFAKQNKKLAEENAKLQRKLDDQAEELDQLETFKMRVEQEAERLANEDKVLKNKAIRQSVAPGKGTPGRRSSWTGKKPAAPAVGKGALDAINAGIAAGDRDSVRPKGGNAAAAVAGRCRTTAFRRRPPPRASTRARSWTS